MIAVHGDEVEAQLGMLREEAGDRFVAVAADELEAAPVAGLLDLARDELGPGVFGVSISGLPEVEAEEGHGRADSGHDA